MPDSPTDEASRIDWNAIELIVHSDPAARGLASFRSNDAVIDAGQLRAAALDLSLHARAIGIVAGFCVFGPNGPVAETDGPPGALYLARAMEAMGIETWLISDAYAVAMLEVGCRWLGLDRNRIVEFPFEAGSPASPARATNEAGQNAKSDAWVQTFFEHGPGKQLTHLVAIERPGPCSPLETFSQGLCHNMRGESINGHTAKTHLLFERIRERRLPITTIGIGDGGNEIGMGTFAMPAVVEAIRLPWAAKIACRIATDFALVGGVSDWPAYALALGVARLRGALEAAAGWTASAQGELVRRLVAEAGAVDGLTLRQEATVDGLTLAEYLEPLTAIQRLLGATVL